MATRKVGLVARATVFLIWALLAGASSAQDESVVTEARHGPLSPNQRVHHVLSRFTMGVTPQLMEEVSEKGIDAWLDEQLEATLSEPDQLIRELDKLPSLPLTNQEVMKQYVPPLPPNATAQQQRQYNIRRNIPRQELLDAVLLRAIYSNNQTLEVASDFFRNHLTVSVDKGSCRYFSTDYEREVIRANALGSFSDMLRASAHHPAMLHFLDNSLSRRPLSKTELKEVARRVRQANKSREMGEKAADIAAQRGLNENYARELLELHTLGVDRFYNQNDVRQLAEALTGWSYNGDSSMPIEFTFRSELHMDNNKSFLGKRLRGDAKEPSEGEKVLDILTKHEGTARFLTWKLCRWLVNDNPSDEMVKRIAAIFWKSDGDIKTVLHAIVDDPEFFDRSNYQTKFKRPFEFVVSALRVTGAEITNLNEVQRRIDQMSEPYYRCLDPTGFYDQAEAWQDPGAIAVRWKFALDLATNKVRGVKLPDSLYDGLKNDEPQTWKGHLAKRLVPGGLARRTSEFLDRMVEKELAMNPFVSMDAVVPKIVGALLGSPDFQKQ